MTYFITTLHLMAVSMLTKINTLKLGNLCMWLPKSECVSYADHIDTPHDLLYHYFAPHGSVRANHDKVDELEVALQVIDALEH